MSETKQLRRSKTDKMFAGVCGGMAKHFGMDSTLMRVLFVLASLFVGAAFGGLIAYVILAIVIPEEDGTGAIAETDAGE